jgi:isocitrate/isopropylmalate dehydrogenase
MRRTGARTRDIGGTARTSEVGDAIAGAVGTQS